MDDRDRDILRINKPTLKRDLEPDRLLDHLTTILNETDIEEIKQEGTREKKADKLLDMLPRRGPLALNAFKEALRKGNQAFLIGLLIGNTGETNSSLAAGKTGPGTKLLQDENTGETNSSLAAGKTGPGTKLLQDENTDKPCSRCVEMEEALNLIRSEMENKIKELRYYHNQNKQRVFPELKDLKECLNQSNEELVAKKTEEQDQKITNLQKDNEVLTNEIEQEKRKSFDLNKQLNWKSNLLKKLEDEKTKWKNIEGKLEAMRKEEKKNMEEIQELKKKLETTNSLRSTCESLSKEVQRLKNTYMAIRVLSYKRGFEKRGVVHSFATSFGKTTWVNPGRTGGSSTRIIATRSSNHRGEATDLLENCGGGLSGTKSEKNSWWCVQLSAKYVLHLTHYTLTRRRKEREPYIRNWQLQGSLNGYGWQILKEHKNDDWRNGNPYSCNPSSCTWSVDGELGVFRYFRIFQTGENSLETFNIFLTGIELYGVLIEMDG